MATLTVLGSRQDTVIAASVSPAVPPTPPGRSGYGRAAGMPGHRCAGRSDLRPSPPAVRADRRQAGRYRFPGAPAGPVPPYPASRPGPIGRAGCAVAPARKTEAVA